MKKSASYSIILGAVFLALMPLAVDAASIMLSPLTKNVRAGDTFTLVVLVDPLGEKVFTVKAALSYPADLLRVTSFTFGDAWIPLNQPGFNEINNEKGTMIKTGGYPSGISSQVSLGVITFTGLKEGSARVAVGDDSVVLNSENKNVLTEKGTTAITLSPAPTANDKKTTSPTKAEAPATKTAKGTVVPDQFSSSGLKIPSNVPSPDKAWLYTKLAFLSTVALVLEHRFLMYLVIALIAYGLFRVIRRVVKR